jgi:short-subunit dehydrogenase
LGKAIAEAFAAEGATLFLCGRNELTLYNSVADLQTRYPGSTVKAKPFDLSVKKNSKEFGTWVLAGLENTVSGKVDVLVNNAGIFTPWQRSQ